MKPIELFDDIVTDEDGHKWSQVCDNHNKQIQGHFDYAPECGICGVKGCSKDATHYIDF